MRKIKTLLGLAAACIVTTASAADIALDTWYAFYFGAAGTWATSGSDPSWQPSNPPWTFSGSGTVAVVTDILLKGDSFSLFDNDILVGSTSVVDQGNGAVLDPNVALLDETYSHGQFALGAGDHSLKIWVDNSPYGYGSAYFRVNSPRSVPEVCSTAGLLSLGMLALGFVSRRR